MDKADDNLTGEEDRVRHLSDEALLKEWHQCGPDSPICELLVGEMERRNLDD